MKKIRHTKNEKGQSLFEVFLSLMVVTVIIVALVILASNAVRNTTYSRNKTLATRYSQEAIEWLRGERDADWDLFYDYAITSPYYCLQTLSWAIGECGTSATISNTSLIREVYFSDITQTQITIEVVVFWEDSQGVHETKTVTNLTDWRAQ